MKIRRFSNIHSWMSTEPSHWVASATAIDVRSAGNAGHGPSWTLDLYSPTSREAISLWPPGTITSAPSSSVCRPRRPKTRRIIRRSSGSVSLMRSSPPVTPASAMNEPISMWSGPTSCVQPPSSCRAGDGQHVRADALDVGAHLHEHPREVLDVRLAGGVADDRRAGRQRGGHQRVLGRHDRRLVHEDVAGAQPAARGGRARCRASCAKRRPERAEGVEVRVQAAAADDVAAGRRHVGLAEAGQQRAGEQERGADALGVRAVDVRRRRSTPAAHSATSLSSRHSTSHADALEHAQHRLDVADPRHVAHDDLLGGQDRGGEDRQGAVLVAGGDDRAAQRHAAVDDELLHDEGLPPRRVRQSGARLA